MIAGFRCVLEGLVVLAGGFRNGIKGLGRYFCLCLSIVLSRYCDK